MLAGSDYWFEINANEKETTEMKEFERIGRQRNATDSGIFTNLALI